MNDKEIKKKFRPEFSKNPEKYYAIDVLKEEGFIRGICEKCQKPFWSVETDRKVCGDPACSGGFQFFGKSPATHELDYIQTWKRFAELFEKWGYTPIQRYPVVARWRDDTDFVQASIYNFQPYVVSGEVKPPANPLVVPQFSLRFNDIDNVGITGAHYTGFVMIGQHAFEPPEKWNQRKYFTDIHNWLKEGLGLPNKEIVFHEDVWAGGGNFGPCMEFFSRGLELGNQVYMTNVVTSSGIKELNLKVLDMGMGHERNAWFTKGTTTSYESVFPTVCDNLFKKTGVKVDGKLMQKFLPYSSYLNVDEVEDIDKVWADVAKKIGYDKEELKRNILPLSAIFSIGDHTRSLLVAISDGALPSNVGGGYNLRIILRRALGLIDKYNWDIDLSQVCRWHADYLKPLFPELSDNLDIVEEVLDVEKQKFENTKQKTGRIVGQILAKEDITEKKLVELYDSQGIDPELVRREAEAQGKKVVVPEDFYLKVSERHTAMPGEKKVKEREVDLGDLPETKARYFESPLELTFGAKVVKVKENMLVLDKSAFYPTSGGQLHDIGIIESQGERYDIIDVFKHGPAIVHVLDRNCMLKEGDVVAGEIQKDRRMQLAIHHSATHIINAAAKRVLGKHVNQAGAKKTVEKAHLDITHFRSITDEEMKKIEDEANKIIAQDKKITKSFMGRDEAEGKYGVFIYQGGVVPGKTLRIVDIDGVDVEACGGTHLDSTKGVGTIKIIKTTKIQDGIVRLVFTAGPAAEKAGSSENDIMDEAAKILSVEPVKVPGRADELFQKWKKGKKLLGRSRLPDFKEKVASGEIDADLELTSDETADSDPLQLTAQILRTQPEHIMKTLKRFMDELDSFKEQVRKAQQ